MTTLLAVLMCAALFALAAFLQEPRRCGSQCAGCALGTCARDAEPRNDDARRTSRGSQTLEIDDE